MKLNFPDVYRLELVRLGAEKKLFRSHQHPRLQSASVTHVVDALHVTSHFCYVQSCVCPAHLEHMYSISLTSANPTAFHYARRFAHIAIRNSAPRLTDWIEFPGL